MPPRPLYCADFYFEVEVTRNCRGVRYNVDDITITADFRRNIHLISTPTPRELYVEHLISQNRNTVSDISMG